MLLHCRRTLPGSMTIVDTVANRFYGEGEEGRIKMAFAFAELLNQEALALQADGVDIIQFDKPAFNVYLDQAADWGVKALERAAQGLTCTTAVHICYGYGIEANNNWVPCVTMDGSAINRCFLKLHQGT